MEKVSNSTSRLEELMAYFNLRQADICKATGVKKQTLNNYITRLREPKQDAIYKICNVYNLNPMWFMGYDTDMFQKKMDKNTAKTDAEILLLLDKVSEADKNSVILLLKSLAEKNIEKPQ